MASVGEAYAILKGRKTGDYEGAQQFLDNMPPGESNIRNKIESRFRKARRNRPYKMGERVRRKER